MFLWGQTRPQKPWLLRESLHRVRKPRAFKRGLFRGKGRSTLKLFDRDGERGLREKSFRIVLGKLPLAVGEKRHTRAGVRKCGKPCVFPRSVHPIDEDALELSRSAFDGGHQGTEKISRIVRSLCGHGK